MGNVFLGERSITYGYVQNCKTAYLSGVCFDRQLDEVPPFSLSFFFPFCLSLLSFCPPKKKKVASTSDSAMQYGMLIHRLCARTLIREMQDGSNFAENPIENEFLRKNVKGSVIELGCKYK